MQRLTFHFAVIGFPIVDFFRGNFLKLPFRAAVIVRSTKFDGLVGDHEFASPTIVRRRETQGNPNHE